MASFGNDSIYNFQEGENLIDENVDIYKMFKPLDDVLRCHICFEYFNNCMITKCSHNYCSVCIRRYMIYKSQCPTCFQVASEPELQNNRLIDEILRIYKKLRENIQITHKTMCKSYMENNSTSAPNSVVVTNEEFQKVFVSCSKEQQNLSTSGINVQHSEDQNLLSGNKSDEVSCPVCYITVQSDKINTHLDKCLESKEQSTVGIKKTLPKLVYHLLSEKEIKKKLKEHGLSVTGDRQTLIRRHKNFLVLYNSNCDSLNPKPVSELLREIECQELEARLGAQQQGPTINKKSDPLVIEKEHQSYVKQHQSQFNALIKDVQERQTNTVCSNIMDESGNVVGQSLFTVEEDSLQDKLPQLLLPPPTNQEKESFSAVKIKEEPSSSSEKNSPKLFPEDSLPSSLEDFNLDKTQIHALLRRKSGRRLSNGNTESQRKK